MEAEYGMTKEMSSPAPPVYFLLTRDSASCDERKGRETHTFTLSK
jgi:hypothetical protein